MSSISEEPGSADVDPAAQHLWAALRAESAAPSPGSPSFEAHQQALRNMEDLLTRIGRKLVPRGTLLEDIVQEAQFSVLRYARSRPQPPEKLEGFLYFRLKHVVGKRLRRRYREPLALSAEQESTLFAAIVRPTQALEAAELRAALADCASMLPRAQREAWCMEYEQNEPPEVAARLLGVKQGTVRANLCRAKQAVLDCLVDKGMLES